MQPASWGHNTFAGQSWPKVNIPMKKEHVLTSCSSLPLHTGRLWLRSEEKRFDFKNRATAQHVARAKGVPGSARGKASGNTFPSAPVEPWPARGDITGHHTQNMTPACRHLGKWDFLPNNTGCLPGSKRRRGGRRNSLGTRHACGHHRQEVSHDICICPSPGFAADIQAAASVQSNASQQLLCAGPNG